MINIINELLPYFTGLWTLPWILIGYIFTNIFSKIFGNQKVDLIMKKIGLILLFVFIPMLLFRIFLDVDFESSEIIFSILCILIIALTYLIAYFYAKNYVRKISFSSKEKKNFIKTFLTNQGRSSAFIGGAMLAISDWQIPAAIYMSIGAIFLFALIPYILLKFHKRENNKKKLTKIEALPWYLKIFPWYLLIFALSSIIIHGTTGIYLSDLTEFGIIFKFITTLTIPAALYYVGAGINSNDLKKSEIRKLFDFKNKREINQWIWVRHILFLTVFITPLITILICILLLFFNIIPNHWIFIIIINSFLPITSTNMFLLPYGINKKVTALSISWSTIICVPLVILLITYFRTFF